MLGLTRQQMLLWSAAALVVLLIGANYLHGRMASPVTAANTAMTLTTREEKSAALKVHVVGAVAKPGLYDAPAGSRIADAIQLAGGPAAEADLARVNLAAKVSDGQQVSIPFSRQAEATNGAGAGEAIEPGTGPGAAPGAASGPVDLNSATQQQLEALDGIGPKTAQKIIEYREAHGGFTSIEELLEVPGIGPAKFEQIKGQVVV